MATTETVLHAFVASPSDVSEEREILEAVIRELNITWRKNQQVSIDLVRWETHAVPGIGIDPQGVINASIGDDYDIFIGIMWSRFGTPTSRFGSGTEEEFRRAHARWIRDPNSVRIMFYFSEAGMSLSKTNPEEVQKIQELKTSLGAEGALYWHYNDPNHFSQLVRIHLSRVIQDWNNTVPRCVQSEMVAVEVDSESDEPGFLDLMETLEDAILELGNVGTRMTTATVALDDSMTNATDELNKLGVDGQIHDFRGAKRVLNRAAQDLDHFANSLRADIKTFTKCNQQIALSSSQLASMLSSIETDKGDELGDLVIMWDKLLSPFGTLVENIPSFRQTIANLPRVTTKYNRSKKAATDILDRLLEAINESFSVGIASRDLIEKIHRTRLQTHKIR